MRIYIFFYIKNVFIYRPYLAVQWLKFLLPMYSVEI